MEEHWTTYLDSTKFGLVETLISKLAPGMAAPILLQSQVREDLVFTIWGNATDGCIRNITHRFPDGPTTFCLLDADQPNAAIFARGTDHFIVMTTGLINSIAGVGLRMMNSASLLAYLKEGKIPVEPSYETVVSRDDAIRRLVDVQTRDSSLAGQATLFLFLSGYFITAHELGHLALGHLGGGSGNAAMTELGHTSGKNNASRIMEWDADTFAATATLWHIGHLAGEPIWDEHFGNVAKAHRYFSTLLYMVFTVFDAWAPEGRAKADNTHPEALVRVGIQIPILQHVLDSWSGKGATDVLEVFRQSVKTFEIALFELCGGNMSRDESQRLQKAAEVMIEEIIVAWDEVRESLDRSRLADLFFAKLLK